ncbi:hypothetical protein AVEN_93506-1 [Araneus ventricosus]|uniref:Uncharacterized protein n=1 Tax=Araneus ventricosus TaxID=182803 RepID=A0A4Y2ARA9_ARAVE|nr:hypothetical protein AVEN_93506-1 [Araneus ventricosus]
MGHSDIPHAEAGQKYLAYDYGFFRLACIAEPLDNNIIIMVLDNELIFLATLLLTSIPHQMKNISPDETFTLTEKLIFLAYNIRLCAMADAENK